MTIKPWGPSKAQSMQSFSTRLLDLFAKSFVVRRLRISLNTLAPHASVFAKTCCATACRPTAWIGLQAVPGWILH